MFFCPFLGKFALGFALSAGGFIAGHLHNAAFQYFRKCLWWTIFFFCGLCFLRGRFKRIRFTVRVTSQLVLSHLGYLLHLSLNLFPQWIDQGQKTVVSILLHHLFSYICIQYFLALGSRFAFGLSVSLLVVCLAPAKENTGRVVTQEILPHLVLVLSINMKK